MELDLTKFYTVTQKELENDPEAVLEKANQGFSPILIKGDNGNNLLLFEWDDYFERFGMLYTREELDEIYAACNRCDRNGSSGHNLQSEN